MLKWVWVIIIVLLFLSAGCSSTPVDNTGSIPEEITLDNRQALVVLEKEKEFCFDSASKEGPCLVRVEDPHHLFVYLLQNSEGNCEIFKYSLPDFQIKARCVIRNGQGPLEALNPRVYGGSTDPLCIYDIIESKYLQLDANLKYLGERRVKKLPYYNYSGGFAVPGRQQVANIFSLIQNHDKDRVHRLYSRDLNSGKDTILFETTVPFIKADGINRLHLASKPLHFCLLQNFYYILDKRNYRLIKMNLDGKIVRDIKIKFTRVFVSRSLRKKWLAQFHSPKLAERMDYDDYILPALWVLPFFDGILVGRCTDHDPMNPEPVKADYFDRDLNFKGQVELPRFYQWNAPNSDQFASWAIHYDNKRLFSIEERGDDENWIVMWKIK